MKQKDIALILVIVFLSAVISFFASNAIFGGPKSRNQQVEVVPTITSTFPPPDTRYFNKDAFNPTKLITIDKNDNTGPFKAKSPQ